MLVKYLSEEKALINMKALKLYTWVSHIFLTLLKRTFNYKHFLSFLWNNETYAGKEGNKMTSVSIILR